MTCGKFTLSPDTGNQYTFSESGSNAILNAATGHFFLFPIFVFIFELCLLNYVTEGYELMLKMN